MKSHFIDTRPSNSALAGFSPGARTLKQTDPMMQGEDVQFVQLRVGAAPDAVFGPKTAAAVKRFQQSKGLNATGVVDSITWNEVKKTNAPATQNQAQGSTVFNKNLVWWGAAGVGALLLAGVAAKAINS